MTEQTKEALRTVLGLTPEQVEDAFRQMTPIDVGIFRKEVDKDAKL